MLAVNGSLVTQMEAEYMDRTDRQTDRQTNIFKDYSFLNKEVALFMLDLSLINVREKIAYFTIFFSESSSH